MHPEITSTVTRGALITLTILTLIATASAFPVQPAGLPHGNIHDCTPAAGTIFSAASLTVNTKIVPAPCEFHGNITIQGKPALPGTIITATINGKECGRTTTVTEGVYGIPENLIVSGEREDLNQTITFRANGLKTDQTAVFFHPNSLKLDLTVTKPAPIPEFSADVTSGTKPLTVHFKDLSTGEPAEWLWTFGDGTNSTGKNPVHTYTSEGSFNVSLLIHNAEGDKARITKINYITVKEARPPKPGGGGGGGGGYIPADTPGNNTLNATSPDIPPDIPEKYPGNATSPYIWSDDRRVCLEITVDTLARTAEGQRIGGFDRLRIVKIPTGEVPQSASADGDFSFAGYAYRCSPDGVSFSSPLTLSFFFSEEEWEMIDTANSSIRWNNPDTGLWEDTETFIDSDNRRIYTRITHFSIYALFVAFYEIKSENPEKVALYPLQINSHMMWLLLIIIALIIIISGAYIRLRRKKRRR